MNLPSNYTAKKYLLLELTGALLVVILLIMKLARPYISYHWLTDTLWFTAAMLLTIPELTKEKPLGKYPAWLQLPVTGLLLCLYLFLYHFLLTLFRLKYINAEWLLHASAATLFLLALWQRARENGIEITKFDWKNLLRYPHWPLTIGTTLCMLAPFFKMTKIRSIRSTYGLQFGYDYNYGYGYNSWGYNYYGYDLAIKGHHAYWGHFACLLLGFMLLFHLVRAAGNKDYPKLDLFFKIAIPVIFLWWLLGAKGYTTLKSFGNILFLLGIIITAVAVYLPDKLGEWIKQKGLLK